MVPTGYKLYSGSSPEVTTKAINLLSQDYGYSEPAIIDGKELLFVVEVHTWYGSDPDKPATPHKGVTVYEKIGGGFSPESLGSPLMGIALIGLGYLLWRQS
jgi:hypothetical protein